MAPPILSSSMGLTITNPLILYRALLATKKIEPDPAQHRLALHLQKLYTRLKDYSPRAEYSSQLKDISDLVERETRHGNEKSTIAVRGHPLRGNPLFAHIFGQTGRRDTLALTRVLSGHEAAIKLDSPRGLLLHGEVGTGKSMLVDLLADSLPNRKKRRWHFNTFMLETLSKLEYLRQSRLAAGDLETEYSLLWLAKDMIETSPILFLDEFQLPDRAASKILSNLLTTFFQLGGVLIASSNRMPDELAKASGIEYASPPTSGLLRNWLGLSTGRGQGDVFAGGGEFSNFLEVLKARCDVWDMDGEKDWRRREAETETSEQGVKALREDSIEGLAGLEIKTSENQRFEHKQNHREIGTATLIGESRGGDTEGGIVTPRKYLILDVDTEEAWEYAVQAAFSPEAPTPIPWKPTTLLIYGRSVGIPCQHNGVTVWTFEALCGGAFGPADYITLASTFHTLILDNVPVLALSQKNEARRLITLLDALYESRCKLIIRARTGPDTLFFPETTSFSFKPTSSATTTGTEQSEGDDAIDADAVYPETLSEIYQDRTFPFRPNISSYTETDEDSDFGPIPSSGSPSPDFAQTGAFTGEDERFAYKRARSRLWEMCGTRWHARSEAGWWRPLPAEARRWERSADGEGSVPFDPLRRMGGGDVRMGASMELDRRAGLQGEEAETDIPSRAKREPPPKIGGWHAWGMMAWGRKAGTWGKGVEGLEERRKDLGEDIEADRRKKPS